MNKKEKRKTPLDTMLRITRGDVLDEILKPVQDQRKHHKKTECMHIRFVGLLYYITQN